MRHALVPLLPVLLALGAAQSAPRKTPRPKPPEPWFSSSGVDLAALVAAARSDDAAAKLDRFATRHLDDSQAGQEFALTIRPGDGQSIEHGSPTSAYYAYEDGKLTLALSPSTTRKVEAGTLRYSSLAEFASRRRAGPAKIGTNGYGARTAFQTFTVETDGIALTGGDGRPSFTYSAVIPADAAKALALGGRFVIHGRLAKLPNGHLGDCSSEYSAATTQDLRETVVLNCWVGAAVDRVDLMGPGGTALKSWDVQGN